MSPVVGRSGVRKLRVFANLAISLDGKIADRHQAAKSLGTPYDRKMMGVIRKQAEVVVLGAETLRVLGRAVKAKNRQGRFLVNAIITRSGRIDPKCAFWKDPRIIRFIFTCASGYAAALESSRDRAFIVVSGRRSVDPQVVLRTLQNAGFSQILVEGGGEVMRSFVESRSLQELYLTVTPKLLGGENPSLVGGLSTLQPWRDLKLIAHRRVKHELFLHYRLRNAD